MALVSIPFLGIAWSLSCLSILTYQVTKTGEHVVSYTHTHTELSQSLVVPDLGGIPWALLALIKQEVETFFALETSVSKKSMVSLVHEDFFLAAKKLKWNLNSLPPIIQVLLSKPFSYRNCLQRVPVFSFSFRFTSLKPCSFSTIFCPNCLIVQFCRESFSGHIS